MHGHALAHESNAVAGDAVEVAVDAGAEIQLRAEVIGDLRIPGEIEISVVGPRRQIGRRRVRTACGSTETGPSQ